MTSLSQDYKNLYPPNLGNLHSSNGADLTPDQQLDALITEWGINPFEQQTTSTAPALTCDGIYPIAVNRRYLNKHDGSDWEGFNNSFTNEQLTLAQLIAEVQAGHAFTSPHRHEHPIVDGKAVCFRHSANWIESQHAGADHDDLSIFDALALPFVAKYAAFVYTTASHTEQAPRCRSVFIFDKPVTDKEYYKRAMRAIVWHLAGAVDQSCKDPARLFYGAKGCTVRQVRNVLPLAVVDQLIADYAAEEERLLAEAQRERAEKAAKRAARPATSSDDVIARFNHEHPITDLLTAHGYHLIHEGATTDKLSRPDKKESKGVVVWKDATEGDTCYIHSSNDRLFVGDGHALDAFDCYRILDHGGNFDRAFEAAKREQGAWTEKGAHLAPTNDKPQTPTPEDADALPMIVVNGRQLSDLMNETMAAIADHSKRADPLLFVRGGRLVRLASDENGALRTDLITPDALLGIMARVARWVSVTQGKDGAVKVTNVSPPALVSRVLCAAAGWDLPVLEGITHAPIFDASGTLHTERGYNTVTRLYHAGAVQLGDTTPTPANVRAAVALLTDDIFVDFPLDAASRAHAIALTILPFVRPMIRGATPLHLATAPQHRAGKSLLVESALYPALGRTPDMTADAGDETEWAKVLTSKLLSSPSVVVLDNLSAELRSPMLATAISEARLTSRILGSNTEVSAPANWVWAATGRNTTLHEELMLRSVLIRLTPKTERPEERTGFKHANQLQWVSANRERIVTAIITIVRNWLENAKRKPFTDRAKGRFESWVATMGGILAAAGIEGFLDNEKELRSTSAPEADAFRNFVLAWWETHGSNPVTVSDELFKLASTPDDDKLAPGADLLGEVLGNAKEHGRKVALGSMLKRYAGRVYSEDSAKSAETPRSFQVAMHPDLAKNKAKQWFLAEISAESRKDSANPTSGREGVRGVSRSLLTPDVDPVMGEGDKHHTSKMAELEKTPRDSATLRGIGGGAA